MPWAEQLPSGKWRAVYRDASGQRRSAGTFDHKRRAETAAAVAETEARKAGWRDPDAGKQTWGTWCESWWNTRAVEPGTLHRDALSRDKHLMARWGKTPIAAITRHDVKAWVTNLSATLAPATVQRILYLFSASLNAAIDAEILTANPAAKIRIVKGQTNTMRFLTHDEFSAVADELPTEYDRALATLLVGTGARWGEGVGVHIPRLDLRRGMLRIAEVWDDEMSRIKPYPKGRKIRDVPMPEWVLEVVEPIIGERTTGLVFDRGNGRPIIASNWRSRVWYPAVERSGVGHTRVHDLRHTYASWLIQAGVPLAEVGRLMGHVSPITTQLYAHLADVDSVRILRALPNPSRGANVGQTDTPPRYTTLRRAT
ncbi:MAG: site-specific integrase [Patescibacteria group bacterium]|nr:site-specific integrase [Patescibacteria group bacterium]